MEAESDQICDPLLLKPGPAARYLSISTRKLWDLTRRGDVVAVRIGRAVRYSRDALTRFVESRSSCSDSRPSSGESAP